MCRKFWSSLQCSNSMWKYVIWTNKAIFLRFTTAFIQQKNVFKRLWFKSYATLKISKKFVNFVKSIFMHQNLVEILKGKSVFQKFDLQLASCFIVNTYCLCTSSGLGNAAKSFFISEIQPNFQNRGGGNVVEGSGCDAIIGQLCSAQTLCENMWFEQINPFLLVPIQFLFNKKNCF